MNNYAQNWIRLGSLLPGCGNPVSVHHSCPKRRTDTGFQVRKDEPTPDFVQVRKDEPTPDFVRQTARNVLPESRDAAFTRPRLATVGGGSMLWLAEFGELDAAPETKEAFGPGSTLLTDAEIARIQREIDSEW